MTNELKIYVLHYCRDWMLPEELKALIRLSFLTEEVALATKKKALENPKIEKYYGFQDGKINELVALGKELLLEKIAKRILENQEEVMNYCPKCKKLARTPKAKQCRYCKYDWH